MKIRLHGSEDECQLAAERLSRCAGLEVLAVSAPYPDRGTSRLLRVYAEIRLRPEEDQ